VQDVSSGVEQRGNPAGRDRPPADDDNPAAPQAQPQQVRIHGLLDLTRAQSAQARSSLLVQGMGQVVPSLPGITAVERR